MARMVLDAALLLDQVRHPRRSPQTRSVAQHLRTLLESLLKLVQLRWTQTRLTSGPPRLL